MRMDKSMVTQDNEIMLFDPWERVQTGRLRVLLRGKPAAARDPAEHA